MPSDEFLSRVAGADTMRCWREMSPSEIGWKSLDSVVDMVEIPGGEWARIENGGIVCCCSP